MKNSVSFDSFSICFRIKIMSCLKNVSVGKTFLWKVWRNVRFTSCRSDDTILKPSHSHLSSIYFWDTVVRSKIDPIHHKLRLIQFIKSYKQEKNKEIGFEIFEKKDFLNFEHLFKYPNVSSTSEKIGLNAYFPDPPEFVCSFWKWWILMMCWAKNEWINSDMISKQISAK